MICKSSRKPGIGVGLAVLSLGLAGCPADSDEAQVAIGPTSAGPISKTTLALQGPFPSGRTSAVPGTAFRLYGASLATGATPAASAETFQRAYSASLGIEPSDLVPQELKQGKTVACPAPKGMGLMYDEATGQPKFWLYRYGQTKNGIRVYRAQLLTLVRNAADNPVVWSSSSLHDLSGLVAPTGLQAPAPDSAKSLAAIRGATDSKGMPLSLPESITNLSAPELVVFAGIEGHPVSPRMAIEYSATTAPNGSWHLVADASTGEVLHLYSLKSYATITGRVSGKVTQNDVAMECAPLASTPLPFIEVTGPQSALALTGVDGNYALTGSFSGTVNVSSPMLGTYFYLTNKAGLSETVTTTVIPPATTANLLHNSLGTDPLVTAQANAYMEANEIRLFVLKYMPYLSGVVDQPLMEITVNNSNADSVDCPGNAWYFQDPVLGNTLNFCIGGYQPSDGETYSNTAFANLVHHEYGHHVLRMALGTGTESYGEGMADSVALLYSGLHEHGRGEFLNQCNRSRRDALNNCQYLGPIDCSDCGLCDIHLDAPLLSGTIWEIRENLKVTNPATYADIISRVTLNSIPLRTENSIDPQIAVDMLAVDDDDGNLDNGTPHSTEICAGFAIHGMMCPPSLNGLGVAPTTGLSAEGPWGGPFAPASATYMVANLGPNPSIQYQVTAPPGATWLNISNGSGQLAIGHSAQVTVAINQTVAATLGKGPFNATVQFNNLTDGVGNTTRTAHLAIGVAPIYTETFEGGLGSFGSAGGGLTTGLWHVSSGCASTQSGHSLPNSLYFGIDSSCNYDNGQTVAGTATSGPVTVSNIPTTSDVSIVRLHLNYFLATERDSYYGDSDYDQASVQVSVNGGAYTVVASNNQGQGGLPLTDGGTGWHAATVDLTPLVVGQSSATVRVRFTFDSLDSAYNTFRGFVVDDVQILALANQAPVVSAGSPQTITLPAAATLSGTVTDDGLPNPPATVTKTWSKVSGPGTVTFANPNVAATTATFSASGTYVLRLTGNDSALSSSATVTVTVNPAPANKAPVVSAGSPQTITLPAAATLSGTVTDDGLPNPPATVTKTWSKVSGPGTVTFANPNLAATTATFSASGTYVLKLTGNDSALSSSANVTVTVNPAGTTPCTGLCTSPTNFTISGTYSSGNLGTGAICYQTTSTINGGNCGNFVSPRVLKVNGTTKPCTGGNWASVPAKRNGGYCIQTTTGQYSYAYFTAW